MFPETFDNSILENTSFRLFGLPYPISLYQYRFYHPISHEYYKKNNFTSPIKRKQSPKHFYQKIINSA